MTYPQSIPAPEGLYERIDQYCRANGLSHNKFTLLAYTSSDLLKNIKNGRKFHQATIDRVEGVLRGEIKDRPVMERFEPIYIGGRDPCVRCGVRGDIGCAHTEKDNGRSMYA